MHPYSLVKGAVYWLLIFISTAGNLCTLTALVLIASQERRLTKAEGILMHLTVANIMSCLCRMLPVAFWEIGIENLYDKSSCALTTATFRVFRDMSIHLTCLLSCFQWAIISLPARKQAGGRCVCPVTVFLYLMNMVTAATPVGLFSELPFNASNVLYTFNPGVCPFVFPSKASFEAFGAFSYVLDLFFVAIMALASSHILLVLHRHSQRMKGVRSSDHSQGTIAESEAIKMVVALVSTYTTFYGAENTMWIYQISSNDLKSIVTDLRIIFTMCYGVACPIILAVFNKKMQSVIIPSKKA